MTYLEELRNVFDKGQCMIVKRLPSAEIDECYSKAVEESDMLLTNLEED